MKSNRHLIAIAALAAFGFAAHAQTPPPPGPSGGMAHMQMQPGQMQQMHEQMHAQHMQERMQRRMESLKRILQIAPQQEGAWSTWTAAMRPGQMQRPSREEMARMTPPARIARMRQMRAQRFVVLVCCAVALKALYAQLTPPQQKAFDEVSLRFLGGRGHHGGMHRQH